MLNKIINGVKPYIINFWIFIPVFIYLKLVNEYALNLPYRDDYDAILNFVIDFKASNSFTHKIALLFQQHNEHRIFPSRIIYILYYNFFGYINFRNLIFIGNLQLIISFIVLTSFIRKIGTKLWAIPALILGFCLFDINSYENAVFAMGSMANFGVVMWFLLSLFFYSKQTKFSFIWAIFFQFLCAFSIGNGMIAGLSLVVFNVFNKDRKAIISSIIAFVVFTGLYFVNYQFNKTTPIANAPANTIANIATFYLHMIGGHFSYTYGVGIGFILLLVCLMMLYFIFFKKEAYKIYLPFVAMLGFILLSMATTAKFRLATGMLTSYSSRYFIYTHLFTGILFILLYAKLKNQNIKWIVSGVFLLITLNNYKENYEYAEGGFMRQQNRMEVTDFINYPDKDRLKTIADKACALKIYCISENK